jgi:UDP-N-acetylglucosamine--N-acetylmuramyl-(pentapeptide) pyrophosphoryl-undecaprenol N-acetylglucosamine transferase
VYPGIAVAHAWLANVPNGRVIYIGSPTGFEAKAAPKAGLDFVAVEARRLKNAGLVERLKTLVRMPVAIWRGRALLNELEPAVVLGVGGYVSGPVVLAAALTGRPSAIAEQNARPGLTNRILSRFVRRVYSAFPEVAQRLPAKKIRQLGNPVRAVFRTAAEGAPEAGQTHRVLVIGGSQGARALNQKLPPALAELKRSYPDLEIRHQAGRGKAEPVRAAYDAAGLHDAVVEPFIDDVAGALVHADLVVARAGATTVAELACVGRPALFVPFPYAADDHQAANAASLVDAGAALMAREETLDQARLVGLLTELFGDPDGLRTMAANARAVARPTAADDIVADLRALSGEAS